MPDCRNNPTETAKPAILPRLREQQRRRNALARRKLDSMRERKRLHAQVTDVRDEPDHH